MGFNLFVLADLSNKYTVGFSLYTGKTQFPSGTGLAYDSVMSLIKPALGLGTIYTLTISTQAQDCAQICMRLISALQGPTETTEETALACV